MKEESFSESFLPKAQGCPGSHIPPRPSVVCHRSTSRAKTWSRKQRQSLISLHHRALFIYEYTDYPLAKPTRQLDIEMPSSRQSLLGAKPAYDRHGQVHAQLGKPDTEEFEARGEISMILEEVCVLGRPLRSVGGTYPNPRTSQKSLLSKTYIEIYLINGDSMAGTDICCHPRQQGA